MKESVAAVIKNDEGKILITKNELNSQDMWKFPGGNIETGETDEEALSRKVKEDLAIEISVNNYLAEKSLKQSNEVVNMIAYDAQFEYGKIKLLENEQYKWVKKEELGNLNFSSEDQFIVKALQGEEEWN